MQQKTGKIGVIALIVASLSFLLVFLVLWLQSVYKDQRVSLRREANTLFRTTVIDLQDSLIQRQISTKSDSTLFNFTANSGQSDPLSITDSNPPLVFETTKIKDIHINTRSQKQSAQVPDDNAPQERPKLFFSKSDLPDSALKRAIRIQMSPKMHLKDSMTSIIIRGDSAVVRRDTFISIVIAGDSNNRSGLTRTASMVARNLMRMSPKEVRTSRKKDSVFVVKLAFDSLKMADLEQNYRRALQKANIALDFDIKKTAAPAFPMNMRFDGFRHSNDSLGVATDPMFAGMPGRHAYTAVFPNYNAYILRKMTPQFAFSALLFGLIGLSFWLIYQNWRQQQRLTELKNDFISNVTHELKTPIATVSVAIEAMQNFNVLQNPEQAREYLDISKNELNRLSLLVDKVLKMAIFEQKELRFSLETVDFRLLVEQVVASMRLQFEKAGAAVDFDYAGDAFWVQADRIHLTNVVYNLLDNALKYSQEAPEINLFLAQSGDSVTLSVRDNGIGIPPQYRDKVFEKFFRVPTGDVHNTKGHGLGLSYVASVVQKHGGQLRLDSTVGSGSTFTVELPAKNPLS